MVDLNALDAILSARNGVWATFLLLCILAWRGWTGLPAVMAQWVERRRAIAAEKSADWNRLREEIRRYSERLLFVENECAEVRTAVRECEERELEWRRRAIDAEAKLQNEGRLKQVLAILRAADRVDPDMAPEALKAAERVKKIRGEEDPGK